MEHGDYPQRLNDHLIAHGYRDETIQKIGQICRRSLMSAQSVLEVLEEVEADRRLTDEEMKGAVHPETAWDKDMLAHRRQMKANRAST